MELQDTLSNNTEDGKKSIYVLIDAHNDLHEWPEELEKPMWLRYWRMLKVLGKSKQM